MGLAIVMRRSSSLFVRMMRVVRTTAARRTEMNGVVEKLLQIVSCPMFSVHCVCAQVIAKFVVKSRAHPSKPKRINTSNIK